MLIMEENGIICNVQLKPQRPEKVWKAKTETKNSHTNSETIQTILRNFNLELGWGT